MEKVAQSLGVQLQAVELRDLRLDFDAVLQRPTSQRANAFLTLPIPNVFRYRTPVLEFAAKTGCRQYTRTARLPTQAGLRPMAWITVL